MKTERATKNPELGVLDYVVEDANGETKYDPNGFVVAGIMRTLLVHIPDPGIVSDISQQPAVLFRASDMTVRVTPEELRRMAMLSLRPDEFFALWKANGNIFHLIHDDFYDYETGEALQPRE
jgi:hypothetical protein